MLESFDNRDGWIWFDGQMVPWRDANVHLLTHGLHYASSVFEGLRVYDGRIFKLREHSERLIHSGKLLGFDVPFSAQALDDACNDTVQKNDISSGYIRPIAWRGSEMMAISAQQTTIHVAVAAWQRLSYASPDAQQRGLSLKTASWARPSPNTAPCESKAAGLYMICTMSKHEAEAQGYEDALMLDWRGYIAEATGANIFLVQDGVLHTPTPDCFLDGITRRTVMQLARDNGLEVVERHITPEELAHTQEVFLTGTAAEVSPVGMIDEHRFDVGPIGTMLRDAYQELVRQPS